MDCSTLKQFRLGIYNCMSLAKDALMDAGKTLLIRRGLTLLSNFRSQPFTFAHGTVFIKPFNKGWLSEYNSNGFISNTLNSRKHAISSLAMRVRCRDRISKLVETEARSISQICQMERRL